jgi:hypothetical protein
MSIGFPPPSDPPLPALNHPTSRSRLGLHILRSFRFVHWTQYLYHRQDHIHHCTDQIRHFSRIGNLAGHWTSGWLVGNLALHVFSLQLALDGKIEWVRRRVQNTASG